jgi:hypothetical protein
MVERQKAGQNYRLAANANQRCPGGSPLDALDLKFVVNLFEGGQLAST